MTDFIATDVFVSLFLLILAFSAMAYAFSSTDDLAPVAGILLISYGMFTYAILPILGFGAESAHWFSAPPPTSVSKITLLALFCICTSMLRRHSMTGSKAWPLAMLVVTPLLMTIYAQIALERELTPEGILQIKLAFLFSCFCFVTLSVALITPDQRRAEQSAKSFCVVIAALLSVATTVAFIEVAYGLAPVANFVHGGIELRASSIFHNPNWFAFAVAPCIFIACKISQIGKLYAAASLFWLCTLALLLSGSRSTIALIAVAMLVLALALCRYGVAISIVWRDIMRPALLGICTGLLSGFLAAIAVGGPAPAYYVKLLERVFGWPIYFLSGDPETLLSVFGRISSNPEAAAIVDNAYVYWLEENTLAGIWAIFLMAGVVVLATRQFIRTQCFDDALRVAVAVFVACAGALGQVYWAFPIWPILAVMLGYVVHPIVVEWLDAGNREPFDVELLANSRRR